jgi:hypothetical protein
VGHLRDVRRLVVALSRARLGLYVFGRRALFENCYELRPAFDKLLHPATATAAAEGGGSGDGGEAEAVVDTLQLVLGERWPHTTRDDTGAAPEEAAGGLHGVSGGVGELGAMVASMLAMHDQYEQQQADARTMTAE